MVAMPMAPKTRIIPLTTNAKIMFCQTITRVIVWQNIIFALVVKGIILVFGAMGMATMWEAVFGDVGVALIAVLNAMRVMKAR